MRERLDCAIFTTSNDDEWAARWAGAYANGRLHLHLLTESNIPGQHSSITALSASAIQLRCYDACLLPVYPTNLAWARTALAAAGGILTTPVLVLARDLKATALADLYDLGVADFVRDPVCMEELRVRLERIATRRQYPMSSVQPTPQLSDSPSAYAARAPDAALISMDAFCESILERNGDEIEAYAVASATRCSTNRDSFRTAKGKVIERFERAYITAALGRHSGNIAMAARTAQKHRRAFWALMRKHEIDANPFRAGQHPKAH